MTKNETIKILRKEVLYLRSKIVEFERSIGAVLNKPPPEEAMGWNWLEGNVKHSCETVSRWPDWKQEGMRREVGIPPKKPATAPQSASSPEPPNSPDS